MNTSELNPRRDGLRAMLAAVVAASAMSIAATPAAAQCQGVKKFATSPAVGERLGLCAAMDAAGQFAVAGPMYYEGPAGPDAGAAYVFSRSGSAWSAATEIVPADAAHYDYFGESVSMSADGLTMLVGAVGDDSGGVNEGAGYIYTRNGSTWVYQAQLLSPDDTYNNQYGCSAALSGDGNIAVIGSRLHVSGNAVYIFTRTGSTWSFQQKLVPVGADGTVEFGFCVDISASGQVIAVGAPSFGPDTAGAVQVFTQSETSWQHAQTLVASDPARYAQLGIDISLDPAGSRLLIGSIAGSAYVFEHDGRTWSQSARLTSPNPEDGLLPFGQSVAIQGDLALIGAAGEDVLHPCAMSPVAQSGAAYLYGLERGEWTLLHRFFAADGSFNANFGFQVVLGGQHAMITALNDSGAATQAGAVYFFDLASRCPSSDMNYDGVVNGIDLAILLGSWSSPPGAPGCGGVAACPADISGDCTVNGVDLNMLLGSWG